MTEKTTRGRQKYEPEERRDQKLSTYVTPGELAAVQFMSDNVTGHAGVLRKALAHYAQTFHPDLYGRFRKDLR